MSTENTPCPNPEDVEQVITSLSDTIGALAEALPRTPANRQLHARAKEATEIAHTTIAVMLRPDHE